MGVNTCDDETFNLYRKQWSSHLQNIKLPEDMNPSIGQFILSQLDEAYAILRIDFAEIEASRDKAESIIRQNERSKANGKNEDDRKKNATEYLENYPVDEDETVDMYEWVRLLNYRYSIIKGFVDVINNKQNRLITMSGFLKIDTNLGSGMHQ